jgi:hypothetical protein
MIWRIVTRYSELVGREVAMDPPSAYGVLDGLFQAALLGHVTGNGQAVPSLVGQVHALMPLTLVPAPSRDASAEASAEAGPDQGRDPAPVVSPVAHEAVHVR